jgi:2-polyprenyl-3-methyl-5-hydroxy-6-metoxy-1,4-benzoquinol methylase
VGWNKTIKSGWLYGLYQKVLMPLEDNYFGGLHSGIVVKGLYLKMALKTCLKPETKMVLDAGCGPDAPLAALVASRYPFCHVEAWDLHLEKESLQKSSQRRNLTNLSFVEADLMTLKKTAAYDLIYSIDVLEHVPDFEHVMDNLVAALRPNGQILIHVPSHDEVVMFQASTRRPADVYREARTGDDHVKEGFDLGEVCKVLESRSVEVIDARWTFNRATSLLKELYWIGEQRRLLGIGVLLLPFVLWSVWIEMHFPPKRGNGLWVQGIKRDTLLPRPSTA